MTRSFDLTVLTPEGEAFSSRVRALSLRTEEGLLTLLCGHAPLVACLSHGLVRILCEDGREFSGRAERGILSFSENRALLLCTALLDAE